MRLQLSSFAWRILNAPVADFTAASIARDNSVRDPKESKHHGSPRAPGLSVCTSAPLGPKAMGIPNTAPVSPSMCLQWVFLGNTFEKMALHGSLGIGPPSLGCFRAVALKSGDRTQQGGGGWPWGCGRLFPTLMIP